MAKTACIVEKNEEYNYDYQSNFKQPKNDIEYV